MVGWRDPHGRVTWTTAAERLRPWRELIAMAALVAAFLSLAYFAGFMRGLGGWVLISLAGAALLYAARGARAAAALSAAPPGPGVVDISERRVGYLSARGGGFVSLEELMRVEIRTTPYGPLEDDVYWVLTPSAGRPPLEVPIGAAGADALLTALGGLPGFDHDQVVRAMTSTADARFLVWRREPHDASEPDEG